MGIRAFFLLICCVFRIVSTFAQNDRAGTWNILSVKYDHTDKLSFFGEAQLRSLRMYDHFHYHEFKFGVSYKVHPQMRFALAAGDYDTYREGGNFVFPKNNDEFRIWPQLVLQQSIWKLKLEQRYRAEFRFTSKGYRNRFRYRVGVTLPLGKDKNGVPPMHLNLSNELFFTDKEPYFERNRLFLSFNYKVAPSVSWQVGYLRQFDYKINDETGKNFLVFGIFFDFVGKKSSGQKEDDDLKDN